MEVQNLGSMFSIFQQILPQQLLGRFLGRFAWGVFLFWLLFLGLLFFLVWGWALCLVGCAWLFEVIWFGHRIILKP